MSLLDDVISVLQGAIQYQDYIAALCPFHDDSRPSFIVHEDTYQCYSCGAFGTTASLVKKLSGNVVFEKKTRTWNPFSKWLKTESLGTVLKTAHQTLKNSPSVYMSERGIPAKTQIELWLGMRDGWITFPIVDQNNKLVGAVARVGYKADVASKYVVPNHQNPNLPYVPSWKAVNRSSKIYMTFGIVDAITLYMYGEGAMSTTNGKRIDYTVLYNLRKHILVVPDRGEEKEARELVAKLDWRGKVVPVNYPDGCKDINEVHLTHPDLITESLEAYNGARLAVI